MYTEYQVVELKPLAEAQFKGRIKLDVPGDDCGEITFRAKTVRYNAEEEYYWQGQLESEATEVECGCNYGTATFVSTENGKIGHISVEDDVFEVLQISSEKHIVAKIDNSRFTDRECATPSRSESAVDDSTDQSSSRNGQSGATCNVRCLVLTTPNAQNLEGIDQLRNRIDMGIAQTNQALRNSDISSCNLEIELVGIGFFNVVETGNIENDIAAFTNPATGIVAIRNAAQADIVIIMTDGDYPGIFGIVPAIGPINASAFAIVETGAAATARFTFAHEVAHLFGAEHNDTQSNTDARGRIFKTGKFLPCIGGTKQRTILSRMGTGESRIQYYSNPDVEFLDKPTGTDSRNNAQQLMDQACTVAAFRNTVEPYNINVGGNLFDCPCGGVSLQVDIFGGTVGATYQYVWETSEDGINFSTITYTGNGAYIQLPCTLGDGVFARVTVTDSNGLVRTQTVFAETSESPDGDIPCAQLQDPSHQSGHSSYLSAFPNPTSETSVVVVNVTIAGTYTVVLRDVKGGVVNTLLANQLLPTGRHLIEVDLPRQGLYMVTSSNSEGRGSSIKLVKL